jgi:hypothetical protein
MEEPLHAQVVRPLFNAHLQNARSAVMNSHCRNVNLFEGATMGACFTNTVTFFNKNIYIASTTSKKDRSKPVTLFDSPEPTKAFGHQMDNA